MKQRKRRPEFNTDGRRMSTEAEMKIGAIEVRKSQIALALALEYLRDGTFSNGGRQRIEVRSAESPTRKGYLAITLGIPKQRGTAKVLSHVLCWTFRHGPIPDGLQVNHKDTNKANNRGENHELVTGSGNIRHSYANGRTRPWSSAAEWRPGIPKRTPEQIAHILQLVADGKSQASVCRNEGISRTHLQRLIKKSKGAA
jgi:hypothetical protein